jgi:hypothetical protein
LLHKGREAVEAFRPEALVMIEPVHGLLHRGSGQLAGDGAADLAPCDQSGVGQHVEMLHDGGERHGKRPRELAYRNARAAIELRKERSPRRVCESGEGAIEAGILILNHQVKYMGNWTGASSLSQREAKRSGIVDRRGRPSYGPPGLNGWPSAAQAIFISQNDG